MSKSENSKNIFRLLRIARDVKVKDLAVELRVTPAYINAIENGTRNPSSRLIKDYSEVLNIDENIILEFYNNADKHSRFEEIMLSLLKIICE